MKARNFLIIILGIIIIGFCISNMSSINTIDEQKIVEIAKELLYV